MPNVSDLVGVKTPIKSTLCVDICRAGLHTLPSVRNLGEAKWLRMNIMNEQSMVEEL